MERHGNPSAIGMAIDLVRAAATIQSKPVPDQGRNHLARVNISEPVIVDAHESNGHSHARFGGDVRAIEGFVGNAFAALEHAFDDQMDDLVDVLPRFSLR